MSSTGRLLRSVPLQLLRALAEDLASASGVQTPGMGWLPTRRDVKDLVDERVRKIMARHTPWFDTGKRPVVVLCYAADAAAPSYPCSSCGSPTFEVVHRFPNQTPGLPAAAHLEMLTVRCPQCGGCMGCMESNVRPLDVWIDAQIAVMARLYASLLSLPAPAQASPDAPATEEGTAP